MDSVPEPCADIDEAIWKCFKDGWRNLEIHLSQQRYKALLSGGAFHLAPAEIANAGEMRLVGTYRGYAVYVGNMETSASTVLNRFEDGSLRGWAIG